MTLTTAFRRILAVLIVVGVGASPLAAKAAVAASSEMAASELMADGMPCCPDEVSGPPDCLKSCPLMATCMSAAAPATPVMPAVAVRSILELASLSPPDDRSRTGPASGPPARPPRT